MSDQPHDRDERSGLHGDADRAAADQGSPDNGRPGHPPGAQPSKQPSNHRRPPADAPDQPPHQQANHRSQRGQGRPPGPPDEGRRDLLKYGLGVAVVGVVGLAVWERGSSDPRNLGGTVVDYPEASFSVEFDDGSSSGWGNDAGERVVVLHQGGDAIESDNLRFSIANTSIDRTDISFPDSRITPGHRIGIDVGTDAVGNYDVTAGDEFSVIWADPEGDFSQVLDQRAVPARG